MGVTVSPVSTGDYANWLPVGGWVGWQVKFVGNVIISTCWKCDNFLVRNAPPLFWGIV